MNRPSHYSCWYIYRCAALTLPFDERGDEYAAEVRDVGGYSAPDRVRSVRETPDFVPDSLLGRSQKRRFFRLV